MIGRRSAGSLRHCYTIPGQGLDRPVRLDGPVRLDAEWAAVRVALTCVSMAARWRAAGKDRVG